MESDILISMTSEDLNEARIREEVHHEWNFHPSSFFYFTSKERIRKKAHKVECERNRCEGR